MVARFFANLGPAYELRSRLRRLCPQLFGPKNEDQEADSIALKTWTKDAGILALYDLKMIASPTHAGNKFLRLGYLGDSAQLPYPVNRIGTRTTLESCKRRKRDWTWCGTSMMRI
jgi:hypothetical protein